MWTRNWRQDLGPLATHLGRWERLLSGAGSALPNIGRPEGLLGVDSGHWSNAGVIERPQLAGGVDLQLSDEGVLVGV